MMIMHDDDNARFMNDWHKDNNGQNGKDMRKSFVLPEYRMRT